MADWRMKILTAEAERLIELAREDAQLRADLRELARTILDSTADHPPRAAFCEPDRSAGPDSPAPASPQPSPVAERPAAEAREAREPLRELTLGRSSATRKAAVTLPPSSGSASKSPLEELTLLEARCRRKAEAARRAARCQRGLPPDEGRQDEDPPLHPEIAEWTERWTEALYWQYASETSPPVELSVLDHLGGGFESAAEALALAMASLDQPRVLEQVLSLLAEAQSALRTAIQQLQTADDPDQLQIFEWLKATAARRRIYIRRFMRAGDSADPGQWAELLGRIQKLAERSGRRTRKLSRHEALFDRLRAGVEGVRGGAAAEPDWRAIIAVVEEILGAGVPPSSREIRELLLPVVNDLPDCDDLPQGFRLVLRAIDRFLASHDATEEPPVAPTPAAEVKEAARLLSGRSMALIGGSRRREAQESLRQALGLKELIWIETREHEAAAGFEPIIARRDVAVVLLAIRWASHGFGDVKPLCDRHGKPLVRLPGGYNPNQVAAQILAQCSGYLAKST